jgi:hypothetical protein
MTDPNRHPADRLADIRAEIAVLREEEENLRQGFISGALPLYGDEFTVNVERKENLRIDGAALRKHVDEVVWRPFAITATSDYDGSQEGGGIETACHIETKRTNRTGVSICASEASARATFCGPHRGFRPLFAVAW